MTSNVPAVDAPGPQGGDDALVARIEGGAIGDRIYKGAITFFALCIPLLLVAIALEIGIAGWPAFARFGFSFLTTSTWDPVREVFGAASAIYGTLVSSAIALVLATPLAIGVALFLSDLAPRWLRQPVGFLVDLLAAIPSVVYGLWGIFVLLPLIREYVAPFFQKTLGLSDVALFSGPAYGNSMLAAGLILAIMVLPYISSVSREVLLAVPRSQREAALALGSTRWEMVWGAVLPYAKSGIVGGVILGLGRALGETMAVTMVIGNNPQVAASLFAPQYTMAAVIANEFTEAADELYLAALVEIGLVLFIITLIVNSLSRLLIWSMAQPARRKAAAVVVPAAESAA
jgi:phosphate transport system permease protein